MTGEEDGLEAWARPLVRGPITINAATKEEWLEEQFEERLGALLRRHQCDASPLGWRDLALRLALEHEECMRVLTPVDRQQDAPGGAEPGTTFWLAMMLRKKAKELGSAKKAAVALADSLGQVKTLQNLASKKPDDVAKPRFLLRMPWEAKIQRSLLKAAKALSERSRF